MRGLLHRHVLLPAFETVLKGRKVFRYWRELEGSQWLSAEALRELQFRRLRALIEHAFARSSYYRESWEGIGLHPEMLRELSDFKRWPVIDRATIRAHRMMMRTTTNLIHKSTGGSSGEPLRFDMDLDSSDRRTAAWHRGYGWAHAAPGTRQLYLWGTAAGARPATARIKDRLYHSLYRRRLLSCFETSGDLAGRFVKALERDKPDCIVAYVNPLYEIARRLDQEGRSPAHRPRSIVVGAEKLHDFQRRCIERVFGAPVFETYGSREFMLIGAECERHCGLHLTAENLQVEVLRDDGTPAEDGEEGDVVVTDLTNIGMPFIRYMTGDKAVAGFSRCECGRGLPLLRRVVGRRLDIIRLPGGRALPGEFFPHLMKDFASVRRFQVVQESSHAIRLTLVTESMPREDRLRLERLVRESVGPEMRVDFEDVESIPLSRAGKLQVVVNRSEREAA